MRRAELLRLEGMGYDLPSALWDAIALVARAKARSAMATA